MAWEDKDIVNATLAGLAIAVSIGTVFWQQWHGKKQAAPHLDATRLHAAKKLREAAYKVRDEVVYCRAPLVQPHEHSTPMDTWQNRAQAYREVFAGRWKPVRQALDELAQASREAEALFGPNVKTKVDALRQCARELYVGIDSYIANEQSQGADFEADRDFGRQIRATAFASLDDADNALNKSIWQAVADIDALLAPQLG